MGNVSTIGGLHVEMTKYWLWLSMALGPTNRRAWEVTRQYETILDAYNSITGGNYSFMTQKEISSFKTTHIEQAEKMLEYCEKNSINIYCFDDEENYPARLRDIYNPPTVLYCYGSLEYIDDSVVVGVIGARAPSEYSVRVAESICTELSRVDTVIVSGFAYGIDSVAHKSALKNKGRTVAVLGCGIDYDYPPDNAKIKQVIARNGAVISEYPPGAKSSQDYFKQRNRLISALSQGVLIVEASSKSGSLNTAAHALSQGRDIFCIPPHDIFDERYCGVCGLLRDGATPVFSHLDIMYQYYDNFSGILKNNSPFESILVKPRVVINETKPINTLSEDKKKKTRPKSKKQQDSEIIDSEKNISGPDISMLSGLQYEIAQLLSLGTRHADEITQILKANVSDVLTELTELELMGIIKAYPGNRYSLNI